MHKAVKNAALQDRAKRGATRLWGVLRAAPGQLWRQVAGGLAARIVAAAFAATLVTSLGVTAISVRSTESFLHRKINEKFPALMRAAAERLELAYSQRLLEIETFARSAVLTESFSHLQAGAKRKAAREDAGIYLSYVLERFPQYEALFALDDEGEELARAGAAIELPADLRQRLAAVGDPQVSGLERLPTRNIQVVSAPVHAAGRRRATLHALVDVESLQGALATDDLGASGGLYVVAADGRTLLRSPGSPPRARYEGPQHAEGPARVDQYTDSAGERVIGGAIALPRFGWSLAVQEAYSEAFAPVVALVRGMLRIHLVIVLLFGLVGFQLARSIVRPIVALSAGARRIAGGETGVEIPVSTRADEIGVLTRAISEMTARLHNNQIELEAKQREIEEANARLGAHNQQLRQMNEVLEQLSITDGLTRLHNHRFFQDHLPREIKRSQRTGDPLSLMLIDIDDFKGLNDEHGHAAGDVVLRESAEIMSTLVRDMDLLARYGGEEFALLASQTDLAGAVALGEKIRQRLEKARFRVDESGKTRVLRITVSVGVAAFKGDPSRLFNDADQALYRAKDSGKNRVEAAS